MRYRWAVTFEFEEAKPETVRGEMDVPNPRLGARRAVEAAQKAKPGMRFQSLVIVLDRKVDA